jgi:hypothetical protein
MVARNRVRISLSYRSLICKRLRNPRIYSKESNPPAYASRAGILKQSMGARNRVGRRLSYRPARLYRLAELNPWNRFLESLKAKTSGSGRICSLDRFLGILKVYKFGLRPARLLRLIANSQEEFNITMH